MATKFDWNAPLYCNAYIAATIGAEAGIVYERLRWMVQDCKGKKTEFGTLHEDGRWWVDFTYAQLFEYVPIFKSVKALRDVMTKLEKVGLIESKSLPRAKWYTISDLDPTTLTKIVSEPCRKSSAYPDENRHDGVTEIVSDGDENRHPPYNKESESTPKQQSETTTESFSFSQPSTPTTEQKEIIPFILPEDDLMVQKLATLTGVNIEAENKLARQISVTLQGHIREIKRLDPTLKATDFDRYLEYYQLQAPSRPRPTASYMIVGWKGYKTWLNEQQPAAPDVAVGDFLPDTGLFVYALPVYWQQVAQGVEAGWVMDCMTEDGARCQFIKQPDGTFSRAAQAS